MLAAVPEPACITGRLAAHRLSDLPRQRQAAIQEQRAGRSPSRDPAGNRRAQLRLLLRSDSRNFLEPSSVRRRPQLVERPDAQRLADLHRLLRAQAEHPADADEVGRDALLELLQLVQLAGLDELAQPRLDRRADAAQLSDPSRADEVGDRDGRLAHELRGAPVRTDAVAVRARQLEQRGE